MRREDGSTLIELLIAMTVISVGLFAAATLVYGNLALVDRSNDEIQSVNLAREGIELTKHVRDSNWLAGKAFDEGLVGVFDATDYTATPVWDGVMPGPVFDFGANDFLDSRTLILESMNQGAQGFFVNLNLAPPMSGTSTPFKRLLTFHPICRDTNEVQTILDSGKDCTFLGVGTVKAGIRVESHVQWIRKGRLKDITLYDDMYDWR